MRRLLAGLLLATLLATGAEAAEPTPDAVRALAPGGTLRAALNFGNPVLAQRDPATGEARGVSAELARLLAERLHVPLQVVPYAQANGVTDALARDEWDVAFLAIDPVRGADLLFTPPYVLIEGIYVVPAASPLQTGDAVDADGVRIVVARASTYDLYLTRALKHARLLRFPTADEAANALLAGDAEVIAGVRQVLAALVQVHPELRPLPGRFMAIQQAMATKRGREAGAAYLRAFIEEMKASGVVLRALAASGQGDAAVAPAE